jgi:hypothetical protein
MNSGSGDRSPGIEFIDDDLKWFAWMNSAFERHAMSMIG